MKVKIISIEIPWKSSFSSISWSDHDAVHYPEIVNRVNEIYEAADVMKARAVNRAA